MGTNYAGGPLRPWEAPESAAFKPRNAAKYSGTLAVAANALVSPINGYLVGMTHWSNAVASVLTCYNIFGAALAAPTSAIGAAGAITGTVFQHYVHAFNSRGIGTLIGTKSTSRSVTNQKIELTDIPLGPPGTIYRKIFRNNTGGSTWFELATINDNTTTSYSDNNNATLATAAYDPNGVTNVLYKSQAAINAAATTIVGVEVPIYFPDALYYTLTGTGADAHIYWISE